MVDAATWRELLGPFTGARKLCKGCTLSWELSGALEWAELGSDPGLLPNIEELVADLEEEHADNAFLSFIKARQIVGRPGLLSVLRQKPVRNMQSVPWEHSVPFLGMHRVSSQFATWQSYNMLFDKLYLHK